MSTEKFLALEDATFDSILENTPLPVVVDFYAPWCNPCKVLEGTLKAVAKELGDQIVVGKVDVDKSAMVPKRYGVESIPTVLIFKDRVLLDTIRGPIGKADLARRIRARLS